MGKIEPMEEPRKSGAGKRTLAGVVGIGVAVALGVSIPKDESGRTVSASADEATQELKIEHISGKQYLRAYLDIVKVPTACDGITKDIHTGQTFTEKQCTAMLERELIIHAEGVMKCSPGLAISKDITEEARREGPRFAAVSLAYNVGIGAYCGSTARKLFNVGNYLAGCNAILRWNKAGGRVVRGLQLRRERERQVCLKGLKYV